MAEMTALATAVYKRYTTELAEGFEQSTPGVTSRFEVFHDDTIEDVAVGYQIRFMRRGNTDKL